ncbi:U-box domain-containing protein 8 [Ancistrocladus abbreviatus]
MSDPVILPSGHTFDGSSIQRWLDSGNRTCPITKLALPEPPSLIPNYALRSLISNHASLSPPPTKPDPYISHSAKPQSLISSLTSPFCSLRSKLESLNQLNKFLKSNPGLRRRLSESGAVSAVLRCVDSDCPSLQEKALSLLLTLSLDDDNKVGLVIVEVNKAAIGAHVLAIRPPEMLCTTVRGLGYGHVKPRVAYHLREV